MKFALKLIAASLALAAAGQASATIADPTVSGTGGGPEMFLAVWDSAAQKSYVRDLGVHMNDFLPAAGLGNTTGFASTLDKSSTGVLVTSTSAPVAGTLAFGATPTVALGSVLTPGYSLNFAPDPLLASFLGTAGTLSTSLQWMVGAYDGTSNGVVNSQRLLTTSNGTVAAINATTNGVLSNISAPVANYILTNNGLPSMVAAVNGSAGVDKATGGAAYFDLTGLSIQTWGGNTGFNNLAAVGTSQPFWYLGRSSINGPDPTIVKPFTGSWTLDTAGNLSYSVATVPLPAAAWLLGSGLMGLIGAGYRKSVSKKA